MSIDRDTVKKLAKLSSLEYNEENADGIAEKLNGILTFVSQLQEVNTDGVSPMASTVSANSTPEREDAVTAENKREEYLEIAPKAEMGFYVVPRVVE